MRRCLRYAQGRTDPYGAWQFQGAGGRLCHRPRCRRRPRARPDLCHGECGQSWPVGNGGGCGLWGQGCDLYRRNGARKLCRAPARHGRRCRAQWCRLRGQHGSGDGSGRGPGCGAAIGQLMGGIYRPTLPRDGGVSGADGRGLRSDRPGADPFVLASRGRWARRGGSGQCPCGLGGSNPNDRGRARGCTGADRFHQGRRARRNNRPRVRDGALGLQSALLHRAERIGAGCR
mmetsp:Transcript_7280/g.12204  ORF Transcript_7280/g.12204 Transcript_7280/m.12204 type:complete len:231 (-) Transcript_7280:2581-3273(-)